jgi:hypothetical protein
MRNVFDEEYFSDTSGSFAGVHRAESLHVRNPQTYGVDVSSSKLVSSARQRAGGVGQVRRRP